MPTTHSSGVKTYHDQIALEGNKWLTWALREALVPAFYADCEIRSRFDAFGETKNANVAKTVMARWLLKVVYHVLKEGRPYSRAHPPAITRSRLSIPLASSSRAALLKQVKGLGVGSYSMSGTGGTNGRLNKLLIINAIEYN
jgi:hypothetical protein